MSPNLISRPISNQKQIINHIHQALSDASQHLSVELEAWEKWYDDEKDLAPYQPKPGVAGEEKIRLEIIVKQRQL